MTNESQTCPHCDVKGCVTVSDGHAYCWSCQRHWREDGTGKPIQRERAGAAKGGGE
jgi:hypothetical protein